MNKAALTPLFAAIAGTTALGLSLMTQPAQAFGVTSDFTVTIANNAYEPQGLAIGNTYKGSFTYDDRVLTGIGNEVVSVTQGDLKVLFDFLGTVYTEKSDLNYGDHAYIYDYPVAFFQNGDLIGLDFLVVPSKSSQPESTLGFRIFKNAFYAGATDNFNSGQFVGNVAYGDVAGVPEPSAIAGSVVGLSLLGLWVRQRSR